MNQRIDAIAAAKEKELEDARKAREAELAAKTEQERVNKLADSISGLLGQEGGVNFHQLHDATGMEGR